MYKRIIIPLDGSKTAENILPFARRLAAASGCFIDLLAVVEMTEIAAEIAPDDIPYANELVEEAAQISTAYLDRLAKTFPSCTVNCRVATGRPEDVIIEQGRADKDALIAMATHARSGLSRWLLGSVTEKILRGAANPLLVVRALQEGKTEGEADLRSVIVPLDASASAAKLLAEVATFATVLNLAVILARTSAPLPSAGVDEHASEFGLKEQLGSEVGTDLESQASFLRAKGVPVTAVRLESDAASAIVDLARKTPGSMVAMWSDEHSGLKRWVLGSVTENVVRHCDTAVLVMQRVID